MKDKLVEVPQEVPDIAYKKILYTTDLSNSGRYAFHHAASLTKLFNAELTVFHVVEGGADLDRRLIGYVDEHLWEEIRTQDLREAMKALLSRKRDNAAVHKCVGQFCEDIQANMPEKHADILYDIEVKLGEPSEEIVKKSIGEGYDLIIMGAHKHGAVKTWMLGSTVKSVLRKSGIPVLIVQVP